jgi:hypothetical protein
LKKADKKIGIFGMGPFHIPYDISEKLFESEEGSGLAPVQNTVKSRLNLGGFFWPRSESSRDSPLRQKLRRQASKIPEIREGFLPGRPKGTIFGTVPSAVKFGYNEVLNLF